MLDSGVSKPLFKTIGNKDVCATDMIKIKAEKHGRSGT